MIMFTNSYTVLPSSCTRSGGSFVFALIHLYFFCWSLLVKRPVSSLIIQRKTLTRESNVQISITSKTRKVSLWRTSCQPQALTTVLFSHDASFRDEHWKERARHWVILVDDEEAIRHAVGDFLFDQGYQVTACSDADAMFQVIFNSTGVPERDNSSTAASDESAINIPDIIISDVRMPHKDGIQITEFIRSHERLRRVPVVLLTAKSLTQDRVAGYRAGADVYLPKPFSPEELLSIIDGVILRRQQMAGERGKMADLAEELSYVKQILQQDTGRSSIDKDTSSNSGNQRRQIRLTLKEQEVLEMLSMGYTNSEIAAERGVSTVAVNRTIQALYRKTSTSTRTELLRWGIQNGQLPKP